MLWIEGQRQIDLIAQVRQVHQALLRRPCRRPGSDLPTCAWLTREVLSEEEEKRAEATLREKQRERAAWRAMQEEQAARRDLAAKEEVCSPPTLSDA